MPYSLVIIKQKISTSYKQNITNLKLFTELLSTVYNFYQQDYQQLLIIIASLNFGNDK